MSTERLCGMCENNILVYVPLGSHYVQQKICDCGGRNYPRATACKYYTPKTNDAMKLDQGD